MSVRFPTRNSVPAMGSPAMGEPLRAKYCTCNLQVLDPDGICVSCGYFPKATVDETWQRQARATGYTRPVSELDEYRKSLIRRSFGSRAA